MTTLKQAREQGGLDRFVKEHKTEIGDKAAFNRALQSMAGTSKAVPVASKPVHSGD